MPKKSGLTNRSVVNHQNGKGDKSRVTNVQAYRDNFDEINWGLSAKLRKFEAVNRRTLEELRDEYEFWHGL